MHMFGYAFGKRSAEGSPDASPRAGVSPEHREVLDALQRMREDFESMLADSNKRFRSQLAEHDKAHATEADGSPAASPRAAEPPERRDTAIELLREEFRFTLAERDAAHAAELQKVRHDCHQAVSQLSVRVEAREKEKQTLEKEKQQALEQLAQAQRERAEAIVLADRMSSQCELLDRRARSKNIMFYNHAGANNETVKSVIVQRAHLSASDVVDVVAAAPNQPVPGKEYPFKVVLATRVAVFDVLRAQASLRKDRQWRVDVDLTPQQRALRRSKVAQFNTLRAAGARVFFKCTDLFVRKSDGNVVAAAEWTPEPVADARADNAFGVGTATVGAGPSTQSASATKPYGHRHSVLRLAKLFVSLLSLRAPILSFSDLLS
eukprot:jgi/Chrzof1/6122/Cz17g10170.t1